MRGGPLPGVGLGQRSVAPNKFFASSEDNSWNYHFDKEFAGPIGGFQLAGSTITQLNSLQSAGLLNWSFDSTMHGELIINFATDFTGTPAAGAGAASPFIINIGVQALNGAGASGYEYYAFNVFDDNTTIGGGTQFIDGVSGQVFNTNSGTATNALIGSTSAVTNSKIFLGDWDDNVSIGATAAVTNNTINLGDGNNIVTTASGTSSINNSVIGGDQHDSFTLNEVEGHFHGMDGDDLFSIDITNTGAGSAYDKLNNNSTGVLIDGGHSNFRAFDFFQTGIYSGPAGIGDTLELTGAGGIDFSNVDDSFIKSIERLNLGSGNQTVILYASDVMQMTDDRNTLVIRSTTGDTVDLEGFGQIGDDVMIDDDGSGNTNFDVYQNGSGVTVLVEDTGAAII